SSAANSAQSAIADAVKSAQDVASQQAAQQIKSIADENTRIINSLNQKSIDDSKASIDLMNSTVDDAVAKAKSQAQSAADAQSIATSIANSKAIDDLIAKSKADSSAASVNAENNKNSAVSS
ncbi:hypothetical protein ACKXGD_15095, partial [Enterococcus lactis]